MKIPVKKKVNQIVDHEPVAVVKKNRMVDEGEHSSAQDEHGDDV
jgi:hypothetical protein